MRKHVRYRGAVCANKGVSQVGCWLKREVSPSTTDLYDPSVRGSIPHPLRNPNAALQKKNTLRRVLSSRIWIGGLVGDLLPVYLIKGLTWLIIERRERTGVGNRD